LIFFLDYINIKDIYVLLNKAKNYFHPGDGYILVSPDLLYNKNISVALKPL